MSIRVYEITPDLASGAFENESFEASEQARLASLMIKANQQALARNVVLNMNSTYAPIIEPEFIPANPASQSAEEEYVPTRNEVEDWRDLAECRKVDPEMFFPEKGGSSREAKKTCLACDVRDECLQYALDNDERIGIWGGLSERERRNLKKTPV